MFIKTGKNRCFLKQDSITLSVLRGIFENLFVAEMRYCENCSYRNDHLAIVDFHEYSDVF